VSRVEIGVVGCVGLVILLISSMPVASVMAIVGSDGFAVLRTPQVAARVVTTDLYETFSSHSLMVIPLFVPLLTQQRFRGDAQP
jgi:C4-dicarboxylate transporter, DctM subunit